MGLFDRLKRRSAPRLAGAEIRLQVVEDEGPFTGDDGRTRWVSGYTLLDAPDPTVVTRIAGHELHDEHCLGSHVLTEFPVAGASHHADIQRADFEPGRAVRLVHRPHPEDRHAIAVLDVGGKHQAGWVPAELARDCGAYIVETGPLFGVVIRELRHGSPSAPRLGLQILTAPVGTELVLRGRGTREGPFLDLIADLR